MDSVLRAAAIYLFLLLLLRLLGKRSLAQITVFDLVLLLIVAEATQQALLGNDFSITNALIVVTTLVSLDVLLSVISSRSEFVERWTNGVPLILIEDGIVHHRRLTKSHVSQDDILESARAAHGLERLDQIKYAILERSGGISVIPNADLLRVSRASK